MGRLYSALRSVEKPNNDWKAVSSQPSIHLAGQMGNILDFTKYCHLERLPLEAAQGQGF